MAKPGTNKKSKAMDDSDPGRRDFIVVATYAMAGLVLLRLPGRLLIN